MSDDPFRFRCPNCGSASVQTVKSDRKPRNTSYRADGQGQAAAREDAAKDYFCHRCSTRVEQVVDLRETRLAAPERP